MLGWTILFAVDIDQWGGAFAGRAPGAVVSQDSEFHFRDAFLPYSADTCGSRPGPLMSLRDSA